MTESCDDGNTNSSDGCDYVCNIEPGWNCTNGNPSNCTYQNSSYCGDGIITYNETCDDNNSLTYDGCSYCSIDYNYNCSGAPSVCFFLCGNG